MCYSRKGESGRGKGRFNDPLSDKTPDELKEIERNKEKSAKERANARRIRKDKAEAAKGSQAEVEEGQWGER